MAKPFPCPNCYGERLPFGEVPCWKCGSKKVRAMSSDKPAATPEPAEQLTGVIRDALAGVAEELRDGEPASNTEPHYSLVVPRLSRRAGVTVTATIYPAGAWKPDDDHIRYSDGGGNVWSDEKNDAAVAVALVALLRGERAAHEETKRALESARETLRLTAEAGVRLQGERDAAERRASEAEARAAQYAETIANLTAGSAAKEPT